MLTRSDKVGEAEFEYKEASLAYIPILSINVWIIRLILLSSMQLKAASEEATRRFETIVRLMNEEIVRFQEQKTIDMGIAFHEFAKGQARLANGIADAWRSLLPKLETASSS